MALAIADLLTLVNEITGRSETSLVDELRNIVHDLEAETVFLEGEETFALTTSLETYALSALTNTYRRPIHLQPIDTDGDEHIELIEKSYQWFRDRLVYTAGDYRPTHFAIWDATIHIWRTPTSIYSNMKIWGRLLHTDDVATTISYPEKYRNLLVNGCAAEVFKRYGLVDSPKYLALKQLYENEKVLQISRKANERHHFVLYNDL